MGLFFTRSMWVLWNAHISDDDYSQAIKQYESDAERWCQLLIHLDPDEYENHIYPQMFRYLFGLIAKWLWEKHQIKFGCVSMQSAESANSIVKRLIRIASNNRLKVATENHSDDDDDDEVDDDLVDALLLDAEDSVKAGVDIKIVADNLFGQVMSADMVNKFFNTVNILDECKRLQKCSACHQKGHNRLNAKLCAKHPEKRASYMHLFDSVSPADLDFEVLYNWGGSRSWKTILQTKLWHLY